MHIILLIYHYCSHYWSMIFTIRLIILQDFIIIFIVIVTHIITGVLMIYVLFWRFWSSLSCTTYIKLKWHKKILQYDKTTALAVAIIEERINTRLKILSNVGRKFAISNQWQLIPTISNRRSVQPLNWEPLGKDLPLFVASARNSATFQVSSTMTFSVTHHGLYAGKILGLLDSSSLIHQGSFLLFFCVCLLKTYPDFQSFSPPPPCAEVSLFLTSHFLGSLRSLLLKSDVDDLLWEKHLLTYASDTPMNKETKRIATDRMKAITSKQISSLFQSSPDSQNLKGMKIGRAHVWTPVTP